MSNLKNGHSTFENPFNSSSSLPDYEDSNEGNQEPLIMEESQHNFSSSITGLSSKGKIFYSIGMGTILLVISLTLILIEGISALVGYFLFPFGIYLLFILSGLTVFGYESQIGSEAYFRLVIKSLKIVAGVSVGFSLILYFSTRSNGDKS
ncbi:hypothetical protein KGF54_000169 [Candida jiufengensis]|uniref:uncharacterized protein n=1 Tax=Candida jiufengensis TaxID=497108 RepID=UPI002224924E|nr:uncharacterized protein KGF54_000169 [Candida jiufengensis]KAI5957241.1 hypothetical protein KGF54_000169 [Candida jiufengensis]